MEREGVLKFPMVAVNDAKCKHFFDNRYGTGQSVVTALMQNTNLILAGKDAVVAGYGWCGKGVAMRLASLGARVIVTEVDPVAAMEAVMDGYRVMTMDEAAPVGDFFCTVTGCEKVITTAHMMKMKDGAILSNAGHFNVEVDMAALEAFAVKKTLLRNNVVGYTLPNGKTIAVIAEGRLVNIAAGDGHPAEIMDLSFAVQALSALYILEHRGTLENRLYDVSGEIDEKIARRKLAAWGIRIDELSEEQKRYLSSWIV
jgi:adenosylhomocysteinase